MNFTILALSAFMILPAYAQNNTTTSKITPSKNVIEVMESNIGSNYIYKKYAQSLGYDVIIFADMKMKINGKIYNCSGRSGDIACTEVKDNLVDTIKNEK